MMSEKKIFQAISKIMSKVGAIEKTRKNKQGEGYMFRGIDDVYSALQPLLHEHGVFFVPTVLNSIREERQSRSGGNLIYTVLTIKYTFYADDGSSFEAITTGEAMDSGDKSSNKAMSAALKYAVLQIFCIPTEEEKDTEYVSHEITARNVDPPVVTVQHQPTPQTLPKPNVSATEPSSERVLWCSECNVKLVKSVKTGDFYCANFKDKTKRHNFVSAADLAEKTFPPKKWTPPADATPPMSEIQKKFQEASTMTES